MPAVSVNLGVAYGYDADPPVSVAMAGESITPVAPVSVAMAGDVRSLHLPSFLVLPGVRTGADISGVVHYDGEVVHYDGEAATV